MDRRIGYARRVSTRRGDTTPNYSQISKIKRVHNVKKTIVGLLLAVAVLLSSGIAACRASKADTSLSVGSIIGVYAGTEDLTATLTSGGSPLSGKIINFTLNSTRIGGAVTDNSGVATLHNISLAGASVGTYVNAIGAMFAGDADYNENSGSADVTVNKANTSLSVDPASGALGGTVSLAAVLLLGDYAVSGVSISFTLNGVYMGSATADDSGIATLPNVSIAGIAAGTYTGAIGASFAGDATFNASNGSADLTVTS